MSKTFQPPVENWDSFALTLAGSVVRDFSDQNKDVDSVIHYLRPTAELWNEKDEDQNSRDWVQDFEDKILRVWQSHEKGSQNLFPHLKNTKRESKDVLIIPGLYVKGGTEVEAMNLKDALLKRWDSDILVQAIQSPRPRRIIKKDEDVMMTYFFFDFDMPQHKPVTSDFLEREVGIIEQDPFLSKYYAMYTTKHGFRVIYRASEALSVSYWGQVYKHLTNALKTAGIDSLDEQTCDHTRLMRLPHVIRDSEKLWELPLYALDLPEHEIEIPAFVEKKVETLKPFQNFKFTPEDGEVEPIPIAELINSLGEFPKKLGSALFYLDKNDNVLELAKPNSLQAYLSARGPVRMQEQKGKAFVSMNVLFEALLLQLRQYDGVSSCPHVPVREDVYYTHAELRSKSGTEYLDKLVGFFSPASETDRLLIKSAFCTPMVNVSGGGRPLFIVESVAGQGSGKTTFAELVSKLYDASPIMFNQASCDAEDILKQILSTVGRRSRVSIIDNVIGTFSNPAIASFVTSDEVSGRRPYGKGMETRKNDLTWFITSNDATFDKDMISRSLIIRLAPHAPNPDWVSGVNNFINVNRIQILEEVCSLLKKEPTLGLQPVTRFAEWEYRCLMNCVEDSEKYSTLIKEQTDLKNYIDDDKEFCESLEETIKSVMRESAINPEGTHFLPKNTVFDIAHTKDPYLKKNNTFYSRVASGLKNKNFTLLHKVAVHDRAWRNGPRGWVWSPDLPTTPIGAETTLQMKYGRLNK